MRTASKMSRFITLSLGVVTFALGLGQVSSSRAQDSSAVNESTVQIDPAYNPVRRYKEPSSFMAMSYSMGFASGDLKSFIGEMSPRGFDFNMMMQLRGSAYVGLAVGYNRFYEARPNQTYALEHADVTGKVYRAASIVGLSATGRYFFLQPGQLVRPYAGLRVGVAFVNAWSAVADFADHESPVGFLLTPEAGANLRITKALSAFVGYQFNFTTASFDNVDLASYHALQVGAQISY